MSARFLIVFAVLAFAHPVMAAKRIALLIGNQDYTREVGVLKNPVNDEITMSPPVKLAEIVIPEQIPERLRNSSRSDCGDSAEDMESVSAECFRPSSIIPDGSAGGDAASSWCTARFYGDHRW